MGLSQNSVAKADGNCSVNNLANHFFNVYTYNVFIYNTLHYIMVCLHIIRSLQSDFSEMDAMLSSVHFQINLKQSL